MFEEIKEQKSAKASLINAVETDKISHCYIFSGSEGTGRFLLAEKFAQALVCKEKCACGKCIPCKQFSDKTSPDYKTIDLLSEKGKTKTMISVDQIREIVSDIYIKPSVFEKKIYIIKNADKMNVNAQNAILKSLEEPPSYVVFILIAENPEALLPTIISRGTMIDFSSLTDKSVKEILKNSYDIELPDMLLPLCMGSVSNAYKLAVSEEHKEIRREILTSVCNFLKEKNIAAQLKLYENILKYEKEKEFIFSVINITLSDISKINMGINPQNPDADYENIDIETGKIYDIMNITFELLRRLGSNIKYNLAVFSALEDIKEILIRKEI